MEYKATLRYLHLTPRKVRRVADTIRGKNADEARALLGFSVRRASKVLGKLLDSAIANARSRDSLESEALRVKMLRVDPAPKSRRFMPRAFGRTSLIEKRMSHVTVVLEGEQALTRVSARPVVQARPTPSPVASGEAAQRPKFRQPTRETSPALKKRSGFRELGRRIFRRKSV